MYCVIPGGGVRCNYAALQVRYLTLQGPGFADSGSNNVRNLGEFGKGWEMRLGCKRQADRVSLAIHYGTVELGLLYIVGGLSCRLSVVSLAGRGNDGLGEVEKRRDSQNRTNTNQDLKKTFRSMDDPVCALVKCRVVLCIRFGVGFASMFGSRTLDGPQAASFEVPELGKRDPAPGTPQGRKPTPNRVAEVVSGGGVLL